LHWSSIEYLATNFGFMDLIINLPVNSLMRAILGAHHGGGSGPGAAGRFLNHRRPSELLRPIGDRPITMKTIEAIRRHYDSQLTGLGFLAPARRTIYFPADNQFYDVLLVSRHERGLELWDRSNPEPENPQLSLLDGDTSR
jgi:hypothetical protein